MERSIPFCLESETKTSLLVSEAASMIGFFAITYQLIPPLIAPFL